MFNVLQHAITAISKIYPLEQIEVITQSVSYEAGYPVKSETIETAMAQIQPLQNSDLSLIANSTLDAADCRKFYFLTQKDNRIIISQKLNQKDTLIRCKFGTFAIFSLNDRTQDGFICAICALRERENAND